MKKKVLMSLLLLIAIGTSAVFAQKVGDTVKVSGKDYSVVEVNGSKLVLQLASLDGVWVRSDKSETVTITMSTDGQTITVNGSVIFTRQ